MWEVLNILHNTSTSPGTLVPIVQWLPLRVLVVNFLDHSYSDLANSCRSMDRL